MNLEDGTRGSASLPLSGFCRVFSILAESVAAAKFGLPSGMHGLGGASAARY
ncbi:hypothetical protein GCM10009095_12700 [Sphingomonas molluscorum]|nr:hypothetical protein GCM10017606_04970 [Microbacterium terregens]